MYLLIMTTNQPTNQQTAPCPAGFYGDSCTDACPPMCYGGVCLKELGFCTSCEAGWQVGPRVNCDEGETLPL